MISKKIFDDLQAKWSETKVRNENLKDSIFQLQDRIDEQNDFEPHVQFVHDKVERKYRAYVTLENLVAMQPNLHHETEHLPLHYDTPRNDGFGVVIVTVCMNGQGDIVIVDDGDKGETISKKFKFNMKVIEHEIRLSVAMLLCM